MKTVKRYDKPTKQEIVITLDHENDNKEWMGIIDARRGGTYEITVVMDHKVPKTRGRMTVKAVAGESATIKIIGMIKVGKNAQETDSFLALRVLQLDPTTKATATPKLEIEANQVKASHAASIGPVDNRQIEYLMSRGLTKQLAVEQIIVGWLNG